MTSVTLSKVRAEYAKSGAAGVLRTAWRRLPRFFFAYRELGQQRRFNDSTDLVHYITSIAEGWFAPGQIDSEIIPLLDLLRQRRPRTVLEIGSANGGTLFLFSRIAAEDALLVSVDLPGGDFGGGYSRWRTPLYRRFALPGQRIELIRGDSHRHRTFRHVAGVLGNNRVDFLFIDGDHTYAGVKQDFERYSEFVRPGGVIALHDINDHPNKAGGDVPRYWGELKRIHSVNEFIAIPGAGCGVGIITL